MTPRPDQGCPTLLWFVRPHRAALYRRGEDPTARLTKFTTAAVPSYRPTPKSNLGHAMATGSSTDATSPTRLFTPVAGQCRWRPEGRHHPRRTSPPPDALFPDPEFIAAIGAMSSPSAGNSVPPPTAGGSGLRLSLLTHSCTRSRKEPMIYLYSCQETFPHVRSKCT